MDLVELRKPMSTRLYVEKTEISTNICKSATNIRPKLGKVGFSNGSNRKNSVLVYK